MPYIKVISPSKATGRLKKIYDLVTGPGGQVDNVLQIHSLRPHTLEGHMGLYKAVLHHPRNSLAKWFLEAIGVRVSLRWPPDPPSPMPESVQRECLAKLGRNEHDDE